MGLFDKKFCDICGEKIGLLGNRKLEDGNMCKNCAKKLSPWFDERRHSTIEEIKKQLEYREKNKDEVRAFNVTRECGNDYYKVYFDDTQQKFIISSSRDFRAANPDVISYSQILNCYVEEKEICIKGYGGIYEAGGGDVFRLNTDNILNRPYIFCDILPPLSSRLKWGLLVRLPRWAKHSRAIPVCPTVLLD